MAKKGLYQRPDGLYEKTKTVDGVRHVFRHRNPEEVWRQYYRFEVDQEKGPLFSTVAEDWKDEHFPTLAVTTQNGYKSAHRRVIEMFGEERVKEVTSQQIKGHIAKMAKTYGYKTVANELMILRLIFDYACTEDILSTNPAQHVKVPKGLPRKPRDFPSDEDIAIVKASFDVHPPYGLLHYFALYTGARLGELLGLRWGDVDMDNRTIRIVRSVYWENNQPKYKSTKTEAGEREVPILPKLYDVIEPLKKPKDKPIFAVDGRLPSQTMVARGRNRFRKIAGTTATPHQLRHAYATMLYEAGIDEKTSQYLLGHAQLTTTMDIYTALRKRKLIDAAKKLSDIDIAT